MNGYTDIHSHFLYGVDDGARSRSEMEAMLDAAYADGIVSLFATPHVTPGVYPIHKALIAQRLSEAKSYCCLKKYQMNLFAGAEIMYSPALERFALEGQLPTLADTECTLVEFVPDIEYSELSAAVGMIERAGYTVIVAHMERYGCLRHRNNAFRLKDSYDIRYQVNCDSILERRGFLKDRFLAQCLKMKLVDSVATDAHDCFKRPFRMKETYHLLSQRYGREYASQLTRLGDI